MYILTNTLRQLRGFATQLDGYRPILLTWKPWVEPGMWADGLEVVRATGSRAAEGAVTPARGRDGTGRKSGRKTKSGPKRNKSTLMVKHDKSP